MVKVTAKMSGGQGVIKYLERLSKEAKVEVKVGILGGATYLDDGTPVAMIGAVHEFGRGNNPPRSFLRSAIAEKHKDWTGAAGLKFRATGDLVEALRFAGETAAKDVQEKITFGIDPALKEGTVAAKRKMGRQEPDIPLVATGTLQEAIGYQVGDEMATFPMRKEKK